MKKRIIGIDVARSLAIMGMIIVNFKVVIGEQGEGWVKVFASFFEGKAAATFVVLAGIGLALLSQSSYKSQLPEKLRISRIRILKRAIFLFVIGLSWIWIWPADILHFYGVYMLVILLFLNRSPRYILMASAGLIMLYPLFFAFWDYESGWNFATYEYANFWTPVGFFRNLFFNGFHPVLPWVAFMLFGLWYGRQDLRDTDFLKKSFWVSLGVFLSTHLISKGLISTLSDGSVETTKILEDTLGTHPIPPMPFYMINGISISILVISACIWLGLKYEDNRVIKALNRTGQLALTFYAGHVIIGMGAVEFLDSGKTYGEFSIEFSVAYALVFSLLCVLFAQVWLRFRKAGPLEWMMRKLTN